MTTLNLSTASNMFIGENEVSSVYVPGTGKVWEHPYSHVVHSAAGTWYRNIQIPQWCNTVCFEMIGGGGGGESGDGSTNKYGRPGGASAWVQNTYNLIRVDGETYLYDYYVGRGGAGGTYSRTRWAPGPGQNGEKSEVHLKRVQESGAASAIATFTTNVVGLGGPASGLGRGVTSGAAGSKRSVRDYLVLPGAKGVGKETVGNSPGGGGGCGGHDFGGNSSDGGAGGNGRIYAFFLGDRV